MRTLYHSWLLLLLLLLGNEIRTIMFALTYNVKLRFRLHSLFTLSTERKKSPWLYPYFLYKTVTPCTNNNGYRENQLSPLVADVLCSPLPMSGSLRCYFHSDIKSPCCAYNAVSYSSSMDALVLV